MIKAVIFDYGRTLADSEKDQLFPSVEDILKTLKEMGLKMALVTRTVDPKKRLNTFKRMRLNRYFEVFDAFEVGGTKDFKPILRKLEVKANECVVVGDRIKSEIVEGNKIGAITIWLKQGKFARELPKSDVEKPTYTVRSLLEISSIITKLTN